ncbi:Energy-coupling factor transporter ATP-binding protein EcfA1 [bioreactor metagenome]|uniref:Energy-coupling factor transporter ATP-binding protein EcfA1 n=1 Tax=bioreactor metagenome TaxID=1076179 RepID=A0A644XQS8_9ZZZZ
MVGMSEFRAHAPHLLSGGQKQRVAIAGIVAMRPRVVVLDEATAMLDPQGRHEVMAAIQTLRSEGMAVILITHHMSEAVLADRIYLLSSGRVIAKGSPKEVFREREMMQSLGLDIPQIKQLAALLKSKGLIDTDDVLNVEEMVKQLCPSC